MQKLTLSTVIPGTRIEHFQSRIARLCALLPATATVLIPSFKTKYASQNILYAFIMTHGPCVTVCDGV